MFQKMLTEVIALFTCVCAQFSFFFFILVCLLCINNNTHDTHASLFSVYFIFLSFLLLQNSFIPACSKVWCDPYICKKFAKLKNELTYILYFCQDYN